MRGGGGGLDQLGRRCGELGLQAVARVTRLLGTRVDEAADGGEQRLDGAEGLALRQPAEPAVGGQPLRGADGVGDRLRPRLVVAGDVAQPRLQPAPPPAPARLRPQDPATQLDRLRSRERNAEHRVGGVVEVMALVEDVAGRAVRGFAPARGVDHHQRVVGDDDVRVGRGARGALDEAFPVVRAARIDAFAAPVGERGGAVAAEQRRQPTGQVAADHVAVGGIGAPARDELRQHRRAPREAALQRVLQVEEAEIVLASFPRHDPLAPEHRIGVEARGLGGELTL